MVYLFSRGIKHVYALDGTKILRETWDGNTLVPLYDNEDSVCGIEYNGSAYYFLKNLQGDVISITDADGTAIANYTYDAWGKLTCITGAALTIATVNPFRYRGYYYDEDTKLYYLQSRYYDADTGRFVNGDFTGYILNVWSIPDYNLFSYCMNEPINSEDFMGFGEMYLRADPQCPEEIRRAIEHSKLHTKRESVYNGQNEMYSHTTDLGNGFYLVSFTKLVSKNCWKQSDYLVGNMTVKKWYDYINEKYKTIKWINETSMYISYYNEAAGMAYGYPEGLLFASTILEMLTRMQPKRMKYILNQLPSNTVTTICISGHKFSVPNTSMKVIALGVYSASYSYYRDFPWFNTKPRKHVMLETEHYPY